MDITLAQFFRNMADVLDDPKRVAILQHEDQEGRLLRIMDELKRYAWEKMGGVSLMVYGTPEDQSLSTERYAGMTLKEWPTAVLEYRTDGQ